MKQKLCEIIKIKKSVQKSEEVWQHKKKKENSFSKCYPRDVCEDGEVNGNSRNPDSHPFFKMVMKLSRKEFYAAAAETQQTCTFLTLQ